MKGRAGVGAASRFRELRAGGFLLRQFERFTSVEVRTWWIDGQR